MSWLKAILTHVRGDRPVGEHIRLGRAGEQQAVRFLKGKGYRIVTTNYRCADGEIDIIALDGSTIVFAEVKTRTDRIHADPQDAVTADKQHRIMAATRTFLRQTRSQGRIFRFDIVAVIWSTVGSVQVEHHANAFSPAHRS